MIIDKDKVLEAKETLGDQNAFIMAELLGLEDFDENNLKACCCFHEEDTPSLIYNPKNYTFHCFGCGKTVDIIDCYMKKGLSYVEAVQKLFDKAHIKYSFGEHLVHTKHQYQYPHEESKDNPMDKVIKYSASRHISEETLNYCDVRADKSGRNMVFNFYDTNDVLTMVKYRPASKVNKNTKQPKCWCQKNSDTTPLLWNMNRINSDEPLLITEGECDCMAAIESGYHNAVSVPLGAHNLNWIAENWDFLEQFKEIIICSDNDAPGVQMQKDAVYRLGSWRTKVVDIPLEIKTPKGRTVAIKDLNEYLFYLGKEATMNLLLNAKDTPVASLVDFADITEMDLSSIDGITTGLKEIDEALMKLFCGTLTIVSGTPGAGKTSFLSQVICQAIEQGFDTWFFSRELPERLTKNWITYVFAGRRHLLKFVNPKTQKTYYNVDHQSFSSISEKYRGSLKIYRDDYANDDESIKTSMVDSVRKYGSKCLVLDNLMCIDLHADGTNNNEKQTDFINWLIQFAKRYNVVVILVCHPRKMQFSNENVGMYDISGSSNIINLAHRSIGLRRITPKEHEGERNSRGDSWIKKPIKYDVTVNVIKDRLTGSANAEMGLYYDKPSRRFYSNREEFDYQYKWDEEVHKIALPYPPEEDEKELLG